MIYYTQLIYIHQGMQEVFHSFEDHVLPLLAKYNGRLLYRVRPEGKDIVASEIGQPYEVHLVSFDTRENFAAYASDNERQSWLTLKNEAVEKVILIEGTEL